MTMIAVLSFAAGVFVGLRIPHVRMIRHYLKHGAGG